MEDLETSFFENLRVAKGLWDLGYADRFFENCGVEPVDSIEYLELAWGGILSVFPECCNYFNAEIQVDVLVCFDPLIDEFRKLCLAYEEQAGLPLGGSGFRAQMEKDIYTSLDVECGYNDLGYNYDYDYSFYADRHGRGRLVFFMGPEFYNFHLIPVALAEAKNTLRSHVLALRKALEPELSVMDGMAEKKEAA